MEKRGRVALVAAVVILAAMVLALSIVNGEAGGWAFLAQSGFGWFVGGVVGFVCGVLAVIVYRARIQATLPPTFYEVAHQVQDERNALRNIVYGCERCLSAYAGWQTDMLYGVEQQQQPPEVMLVGRTEVYLDDTQLVN